MINSGKSFFFSGKVVCLRYGRARIIPHNKEIDLSGGVCDANGDFIESSALHEEYYDGSYPYREEDVVYENRDAVFLGTWVKIYGHAITDNIKKLWFLFSDEYKNLIGRAIESGTKIDLVYNFLNEDELPSYIIDILSVIGIDHTLLKRVISVTQYNNVYVPDNSLIVKDKWRYYTDEFRFLIKRICDRCEDNGNYPERIYLSRVGLNDPRDYCEIELQKAFEEKGYTVVEPETMTFTQQVSMLKKCKSLVTTEGSVAHNTIFCQEGTEVVILRKMDYLNEYQYAINDMKELDVIYIDAHHSYKTWMPWAGPFFMWRTKDLNLYLGIGPVEKCRWLSIYWYKYLKSYFRFQYGPQIRKITHTFLFWKKW